MKLIYGQPQPLHLLCLAPHPDDAEIGAGGTLIGCAQAGWPVGILELTRGELGTLGDAAIREAECVAAAKLMQLSFRGNLALPDGELSQAQPHSLAQALRVLRPEILLVPHPQDRHPDHSGAYYLAKSALHLCSLAKAELLGQPHRPRRILLYQGNAAITPNVLIDVEPVRPLWQAAVKAHKSQFSSQTISETVTPEIIERRSARQMYWGTLIGRRYCEAFESELPILLEPSSL